MSGMKNDPALMAAPSGPPLASGLSTVNQTERDNLIGLPR